MYRLYSTAHFYTQLPKGWFVRVFFPFFQFSQNTELATITTASAELTSETNDVGKTLMFETQSRKAIDLLKIVVLIASKFMDNMSYVRNKNNSF